MKIGTIVELVDGRRGTVVYHGLDGYGIKWGEHIVTSADLAGTSGGLLDDGKSEDWPWHPDAMLREPYPSADLECVGNDWTVDAAGKAAGNE